jgi:hypothetical protein
MAENCRTEMTVGAFMVLSMTWSCVDFASPGAWKRAPPKDQGVSIQRLSNPFNMNERTKAQGAGKGDLFQLTIDEP